MSQEMGHCWTISALNVSVALNTPKTVIQYVANTAIAAEILGFSVSQSGNVTSAMEAVRLARASAAGSGFVAGAAGTNIFRWGSTDDLFKGQLGAALTGIGVGVTPTEPTYTETPKRPNFNTLTGYEIWLPRPLFVPAAGIIGLQMQGIVAGTWTVELYIHERFP